MTWRSKDNEGSLFSQLKKMIIGKIESGEFRAYSRIPSELELASLLGISRQTVRRSLDELVHTGVLYRIPRMGTFVSPPMPELTHVGGHTLVSTRVPESEYLLVSVEAAVPPSFASSLLRLGEGEETICLEQILKVRGEFRYLHRSYIPMEIGYRLKGGVPPDIPFLEIMTRICERIPRTTRERLTTVIAGERAAGLANISADEFIPRIAGIMESEDGAPVEAHEVLFNPVYFKLDFDFSFMQ